MGCDRHLGLDILLHSSFLAVPNPKLCCTLLIFKFLVISEIPVFLITDTVQFSITAFAPLVPST